MGFVVRLRVHLAGIGHAVNAVNADDIGHVHIRHARCAHCSRCVCGVRRGTHVCSDRDPDILPTSCFVAALAVLAVLAVLSVLTAVAVLTVTVFAAHPQHGGNA